MSRLYLILRLASRDLRHRSGEAVMLVLVMMTATAALSLGLVLHGAITHPYETTRTATSGPDVVATSFPARDRASARHLAHSQIEPLARAQGVTRYSGPFPVAFPVLTAAAAPTPCWPKDAAPAGWR